ncbi:hypothetical protein FN846DRAFT_887589 [Sphaerosporella brunnea]|uniref:Uncharacterized protein n=1 Tax=Sphaerosporella brunnea TaxID=1250544 RepID=A0A5J5F5K3_9PEZI|nr:hypothetical protein FN846DRAFT_887589 [Sphaerosporella brunnea]
MTGMQNLFNSCLGPYPARTISGVGRLAHTVSTMVRTAAPLPLESSRDRKAGTVRRSQYYSGSRRDDKDHQPKCQGIKRTEYDLEASSSDEKSVLSIDEESDSSSDIVGSPEHLETTELESQTGLQRQGQQEEEEKQVFRF